MPHILESVYSEGDTDSRLRPPFCRACLHERALRLCKYLARQSKLEAPSVREEVQTTPRERNAYYVQVLLPGLGNTSNNCLILRRTDASDLRERSGRNNYLLWAA